VLGSVKDRRHYPEFTPELAAMMVQETRMLLDNLVWTDGNFMEAFTADYSFLNSDLASLYGVPAPAGEFERVRFPAAAHRAGLLGHGSFLASNAGPVETSPTARGIFIREQLLCQHVPNPPPGVNTQVPEPTASGRWRGASACRRTSRIRHARAVTGSWIRSASAWRTTTRSASGETRKPSNSKCRCAGTAGDQDGVAADRREG
jgi:hypothetical protein